MKAVFFVPRINRALIVRNRELIVRFFYGKIPKLVKGAGC